MAYVDEPTTDAEAANALLYRMPHGSADYGRFCVHAYEVYRKLRNASVLDAFTTAVAVAEYVFGYADKQAAPVSQGPDDGHGEPTDDSSRDDAEADGETDDQFCDDPECPACGINPDNVRIEPVDEDETILQHIVGIDGWDSYHRPITPSEAKRGLTAMVDFSPLRVQMASQFMLMGIGARLREGAGESWKELPEFKDLAAFAVDASRAFAKQLQSES